MLHPLPKYLYLHREGQQNLKGGGIEQKFFFSYVSFPCSCPAGGEGPGWLPAAHKQVRV